MIAVVPFGDMPPMHAHDYCEELQKKGTSSLAMASPYAIPSLL